LAGHGVMRQPSHAHVGINAGLRRPPRCAFALTLPPLPPPCPDAADDPAQARPGCAQLHGQGQRAEGPFPRLQTSAHGRQPPPQRALERSSPPLRASTRARRPQDHHGQHHPPEARRPGQDHHADQGDAAQGRRCATARGPRPASGRVARLGGPLLPAKCGSWLNARPNITPPPAPPARRRTQAPSPRPRRPRWRRSPSSSRATKAAPAPLRVPRPHIGGCLAGGSRGFASPSFVVAPAAGNPLRGCLRTRTTEITDKNCPHLCNKTCQQHTYTLLIR
jgi:hypothetical protein